MFLLSGFPATRAFDCSPGRNQRGKKLSERWRQRLPIVLRHHQGRRFSFARGERVSTRRDRQSHHRSMRRTGCAFCQGIWRTASQPLVWRRAGVANFLRARADGSAASAGLLSSALPSNLRGHGADVSPDGDARPRDCRRTCQRNCDP